MSTPDRPRDPLADLVRDAADAVEPQDGLMAIRTRTRTTIRPGIKENTMNNVRTWLVTGLGGAVATAAVIGGVWLATGDDDANSDEPGPGNTPTQTPTDDPTTPTDDPTGPALQTFENVPVYFVGETGHGDRLFREFGTAQGESKLDAAVDAAILGDAVDSDYLSNWPQTEATSTYDGEIITIDLAGEAIHDLPDGMTAEQAGLALQQVIYTAQAAVGEGRKPVQFLIDGGHSDMVLGEPTSEPLAEAPVLDTLSHVSVTTPEEGDIVSGDTLEVTGVANSFEANVGLRLEDADGNEVAVGYGTAEGWMEEKLFPFTGQLDLTGVAPGQYTLVAMTDDASGGAEGNGPFVDTKIIQIS